MSQDVPDVAGSAGDPGQGPQKSRALAPVPSTSGRPAKRKTYSRRGVLGAALAGGGVVAGLRLLVVDHPGALPSAARGIAGKDVHPSATPWAGQATPRPNPVPSEVTVTVVQQQPAPPSAPPATPARPPMMEERQRITQLLRRATFGYGPAELERALHDGFAATVQRLVTTPAAPPPVFPNADMADSQIDVTDLQRWWVNHMLSTPTPFAERMTLFWHGHFTSDFRKVGNDTPFLYWQNLSWRQMALDKLGPMLMKVTVDPAMLTFLDGDGSFGDSPNENYARELMELFTMGVGHYIEHDVRAAAKALAGWRVPVKQDNVRTGIFEPDRAYTEPVTFLGRTAVFNTQAVIDRILGQDATAAWIVSKVVRDFVTGTPDQAYIDRLAAGFRASGYDVRQLMRDVFMSDEFAYVSNYRSLVKSPVETMVHAAKALQGGSTLTDLIIDFSSATGQDLFDPPTVQGWPFNAAWISSNSVMDRVNFVRAAIDALDSVPTSRTVAADHMEGILGPNTQAALDAETDDAQRWFMALASPEFQHK